ncbi:MAG: monofunctional biosynthetic peptidoglycan transglycosylase [Prevotella sp.]|nr:monofunctional biosynthetic peptidoglycan transglycosylase [Prevotella sp.]
MFIIKWLFRLVKKVIVFFFVSTILAVVAYRFIPVPYTPLMAIRAVESVKQGGSPWMHHTWVPLDEMSKHLPVAAMAGEDARFLLHHGFDKEAIKNAAKHNRTHRKKIGGSTISQQTAKNVFLWPSRTWVRKGLEAYFTTLIEFFWSKHRIMEVYLNSIEMGPHTFGAQAVAREHFNKDVSDLTRSECALIAASLPNPIVHNTKNTPDKYLRRHQRRVELNMKFIPAFPREGEDYDPGTAASGVYRK